MGFRFLTPPECQGQAVEYSYGMHMGIVYRRITDQGLSPGDSRRVSYARSDMLDKDEGDYQNGAPANDEWETITREQLDRAVDE